MASHPMTWRALCARPYCRRRRRLRLSRQRGRSGLGRGAKEAGLDAREHGLGRRAALAGRGPLGARGRRLLALVVSERAFVRIVRP
jgi:hypothetical protein